MKKTFNYIIENIYEGTYLGVVVMFVIAFILLFSSYYLLKELGNYNGRICNYSGRFWVDDTKNKNREGDLKGCFTWEEMIELERL